MGLLAPSLLSWGLPWMGVDCRPRAYGWERGRGAQELPFLERVESQKTLREKILLLSPF